MSIDQNPRSDAGPLLIEDLLHEQQLLTPVARFSLKHESGDLPAQAKYYQDLIPSQSRKKANNMHLPSILTPAQVAKPA